MASNLIAFIPVNLTDMLTRQELDSFMERSQTEGRTPEELVLKAVRSYLEHPAASNSAPAAPAKVA